MVCGDMNSGCKTIEHNEDKWSMRLAEIVKADVLEYYKIQELHSKVNQIS